MQKKIAKNKKATATQTVAPADAPQTVTLGDHTHNFADLSLEAKAQVQNLRITEQRIEQLNAELAIAQTAHKAYVRALQDTLPEQNVTKQ